MLVKEDLRSTKNEILDKYSSDVIHRSMSIETVKGKCLQEILQHHVFLISLCEMLLISACVLSKQFFKEKGRTLPTSLAHDDL